MHRLLKHINQDITRSILIDKLKYEPNYENLVVMAYANSEGSDEIVHVHSLVSTLVACTHKSET